MKRGAYAYTEGCPAMGGMPAVQPERVRIIRAEQYAGGTCYVVEFDDGGRVLMHASRLTPA